MRPRASTSEAIALARIVPGLESKPPQLPEWCAPWRKLTVRSKLNTPREPRNIVGEAALSRGPSEAISTSARNDSAYRWQAVRRPGEPTSSPISSSSLALKPSRPRLAMIWPSAARLIVCWPLLSAVPRPYHLPSATDSSHGERPTAHCSS
jgi:hypothetical protein